LIQQKAENGRKSKCAKEYSTNKNDKLPKSNERTTYKARPMYDEYTPLNASLGRILNEIMNVELKDVRLDVPKSLRMGNY